MRIRNVVVAAIWTAAMAVAQAQEPLSIVVFDNAGIPGATLRQAVETAREAYRTAGVVTEWSVCQISKDPEFHCMLPRAGTYLKVIVLPEWKGPQEGEAMGFALTSGRNGGTVSYALSKPAQALASHTDQSLAVVLGCVMAHEIGHLLGLRHGTSGVMKPKFERRDLMEASWGNLHFAREDTTTMRAFIVRAGSR